MGTRTTPFRCRLTMRGVVIVVCVLVVLAVAGVSGWVLAHRSTSNYRVAVAELGTVSATLQSTGTVEAVDSAQLSFQVAGQVANVAVGPGQQVTAGQVLATLDTSSLASAVDTAQSAVSDAQTKLASDQTSQASAATSTTTTTTVPPTSSEAGTSAVNTAQAAISSEQRKTTADSTKEKTDSAQASSQCATTGGDAQASAAELSPGAPSGAGGATGTPTTTTTPTSTTTTTESSTPSSCFAALHQVEVDQANISEDEQAVAQDESSLAKLENSGASSSNSKSGSSAAASSSVTLYDVDNDQASLDADEAQLSQAQVSLDEAELVSPISGTVASVTVAAGQTVGAGSSTAAITVISPQAFEVSTTASVSNISELKLRDKVDVRLDGQSGSLKGSVIQVGPPPTSSSSTSYPVIVSLPGITSGLYDGGSATVSIIVGSAAGVVTVPTSALHLLSNRTYVGEVRNGVLRDVNVVIGVKGSTRTQVLAGLKVGDVVALANMSQPLPSSSSTAGGAGAGVGSLTGGGFRGGANVGRAATSTTAGR